MNTYLTHVTIALTFGLLTHASHAQGQEITSADWSCYNQNAKGWRFNASEKHLTPEKISQLKVKWQFPPENYPHKVGAINVTPTVVNGYVYFGTSTHSKFYKLKPNGEVQWTFDIGDAEIKQHIRHQESIGLTPRGGVYSSALVTEDSVYFGDTYGIAYCLDRKTGKLNWLVNTKSPDFPGAHHANLLMGSPIQTDKSIIFAGGALEHSQPVDPTYECCYGRGFVMALDPVTGAIHWKYDVGPTPQKYDPPLKMKTLWGEKTFHYGPSTSSVWCTPSFDQKTQTVFFGTDTHNAPRKPTNNDPKNYTKHSSAVIAVDANTGKEKWVTQMSKNDVWNHSMPSYDPETGYKDQSVGDTPKVLTVKLKEGEKRIVGVGVKSGGFYLLDIDDGKILANTPIYTGPPSDNPHIDPRTLALPGPIGGLQTGCASDGKSFFVNGIDAVFMGTHTKLSGRPPTAGRVTSISNDTYKENWRHERPKVHWGGNPKLRSPEELVGDPIASGIAVANGCIFFTALGSKKFAILDASTGNLLKEFQLQAVLSGPSVSRGRVYVGTGNVEFNEKMFPQSSVGILYSYGLPGEDEIDRLGAGNE